MRIALIDGHRREPTKGLHATCQCCDQPVVAKCGDVRIHHWAHKAGVLCPYERQPETVWHRGWKDHFPVDWQERRFRSETGEVHIADVYASEGEGLAVEFQHSPILPAERASREAFYRRLVWVVDGNRRDTDLWHFTGAWRFGVASPDSPARWLVQEGNCALLRDWKHCRVPVFLDFGKPVLWRLFPGRTDGRLALGLTPKNAFVQAISAGQVPKVLRLPPARGTPRPRTSPQGGRRPRLRVSRWW